VTDSEPSDNQLLADARAGDRPALEKLLERHQARVYRFGMKMCRDPEDAKDILQDTLLAMTRSVGDFRGASSLATWLYTIARHACVRKRRRGKFAPSRERSIQTDTPAEAETLTDPGDLPDEVVARGEVKSALDRAIADLAPKYREVLLLRDVEGLTAPEVAEVLGLTTQAVKSRLHRARLSVRERIAPLLGVDLDQPKAPGRCPDVLLMFSRQLEDEIDARVCADMARHVEGCGRCRGACDSLKRTLLLCQESGPDASVPADVQASVRQALRHVLASGG
jgi:RNA polymerase sigma-70 factor (ECF subfamily)